MLELILASQSPRRKYLLEEEGFKPHCFPVELSELINKNINLDRALMCLAQEKVEACLIEYKLLKRQDILVVGSDTVVVLDEVVLGKPKNTEEAFQFLESLSGREHQVKTSVYVSNRDTKEEVSFVETSTVRFKSLSSLEIENYIKTGEPMDCAGAYAIQGLGGRFVDSYEGSWKSIVGFPVERFVSTLKEKAWSVDKE